jgi:Fe-S cluster biogenesis protein NfuA
MTDRTQEEIVESIKRVLDEYIAPAVAGHGGVVNFIDFKDGLVTLEMSGACSGCAGSTMTLKHGAEAMLTQMVPEVKAVEGIDDPFSNVNPFYSSNPFGMYGHDHDMIETINLQEDSDESNNQ